MDTSIDPSYRGYRFPREIIGYCVRLYFRLSVSYRDVDQEVRRPGPSKNCSDQRADAIVSAQPAIDSAAGRGIQWRLLKTGV